ncbi:MULTISPECIES: DUF3800 domain-containing protein [Pseudomonas]|uniref:DUF3800 domain-containing protein n=1 Tax=Pseudomonas TaxID=286 RepID=UPI000709D5BF|nr:MULTISPECIES: DUF3800 domain-containing protein [Pseudomonas]KQW33802.1 hypothetical protein ASC85_03830 [Pseudomonas sp. Root401]WHS53730.1 DUF3800 domain-containing protein [Pseudomonas brassicacearum]
MERIFAFVDESGNHDLDTSKSGSSKYFVVCSVIVAEKDLPQAYEQAETVRKQNFQVGEIKSSNLRAKDSERRKRILLQLVELPIRLFITVVDKTRVHRDGGLRFKQSFIKYVNNLLYERLFNIFDHLQMMVDEHGGVEFQANLKEYVEARYVDDLFGREAFQTKSSKDDVLIQVADFFAGSIAQIYEGKASAEVEGAYKTILQTVMLGMLEWPPKYKSLVLPPMNDSAYADYRVHQAAIKQADRFVENIGSHPDEDQRLQLCILDYLRFRSEFVSDEYVSTAEIANHLADRGFIGLSDQKIRSSGVAKLRDSDVIIASAPKGYKFPKSCADINDCLELAASQVVPLLDRVKKARDVYLLSSIGEYDILEQKNFLQLKKLLFSLETLHD